MPDYSNVFHSVLYIIYSAISAVFGWFSDFLTIFGAWDFYIYVVLIFAFFRFIVFPHLSSGSDYVNKSKKR